MSVENLTMPPPNMEGTEKKEEEKVEEEEEEMISALSTQALELKLQTLRDQSNKHSQALTQKLATSQSGQNLLHIGSSLSTLPPDLHALLTQLHPVLSSAESAEKQYLATLQKLVTSANDIRLAQRRVDHAVECAHLYQDLCAAEQQVMTRNKRNVLLVAVANGDDDTSDAAADMEDLRDEVDRAASLERAANTALCLVQDLHMSSEQVSTITGNPSMKSSSDLPSLKTPLSNDTERAYFVMKLAPRIRKLQENTLHSLSTRLETALVQIAREQEEHGDDGDIDMYHEDGAIWKLSHHEQLLIICHCLRGLALMGKGPEAEDVFARVAIMPLIRSKLSMGRLDQGGSRGECAGLPSLLTEILETIATSFGSVLRWSENMAHVDLVTAGVWVPIATAMMADAGVKMAIFSPGIASIVQSNYKAFDTFLSELARRLLTEQAAITTTTTNESSPLAQLYYTPVVTEDAIRHAQERLYSHPKTAEFSQKWNLPIYYQLRFGDCCSRLNTAVDKTRTEGWIVNVYGGTMDFESLRDQYGFDLPLFVEVFDILHSFWQPDVYLRPLTHRFLRGAVQIIGRFAAFVGDGLDGKIMFGEEKKPVITADGEEELNVDVLAGKLENPTYTRDPYKWGDGLEDVAAVAWELTVLKSKVTHEIVEAAKIAATGSDLISEEEKKETAALVGDVLNDAAEKLNPLIQKAWNEVIVNILVSKCCGPLGAVKGVAATYRMTNRPAPTQASPFVSTILRPLQQFNDEFRHKIPPHIGIMWKISVVNTVANRYSVAVEELIATVQRTEVALQNRRARRTVAGSMSDGDKVKLQLYLDYEEFSKAVQGVGIDPLTVDGVSKLRTLTQEAKK